MSADFLKVGIVADDKTGKGIKSAQKNISSLDGSVKNLAKTFASVFAAEKVISFGKSAVEAFMADQKAAAQLTNTVKNLGLAFAAPEITNFVDELSKSAGVVKDQLDPAMQKLLQTTGSVVQSQKLLKNAIDISRGSGVDLQTVVTDLSNAYVGNNKGLKKYALGLSAAELKTASFDTVLKQFQRNFSGASAAYLNTYAGQMDILTTAATNAKEIIGKGLIDALAKLGNGSTAQDAADTLMNIANSINAITNAIGTVGGVFTKLYKVFDFVSRAGGLIPTDAAAQKYHDEMAAAAKSNLAILSHSGRSSSPAGSFQKAQAAQAAEAAATKRAKQLAAATTKNTKALKDQSALKKQSALFDLQQIELVAALKGKLSDEDKKRAELQLAILQGDEDTAAKLTAQIADAIDKTGKLKTYLLDASNVTDPFKSWLDSLQKVAAQLATISAFNAQVSGNGSSARGTGFADLSNTTQGLVTGALQGQAGVTKGGDVYVTVQGSVVSQTELLDAVQNGLQLQSLAGSPSVIGRIAGMFG
jgi:hypothetical protein